MEDYFYVNMQGYSPTTGYSTGKGGYPINYRRLCDMQHKSEFYLQQHSPSGGIIFDASQLMQIEAGYKTYACQYPAHSWYYSCRKET